MEQEDPFDKAYVNALLYGTGIVVLQFDGTTISARDIPFAEYKEFGQALTEYPEAIDMEDKK